MPSLLPGPQSGASSWPRRLLTVLGVAVILVDLSAGALGLDSDGRWGGSRTVLLIVGFLLVAVANATSLERTTARGLLWSRQALRDAARLSGLGGPLERLRSLALSRIRAAWNRPGAQAWRGAAPRRSSSSSAYRLLAGSKAAQARRYAWAALALLAAIYVWIVSVGYWSPWPPTTSYYAWLGEAFLLGRTDLLFDPPAGLAALEDPYDLEARGSLPILWDASYYRGRYFLYWGPAPGVVTAVAKGITGVTLGDNHLVFLFVMGMVIFASMLFLRLYRNRFADRPPVTVFVSVTVLGLANPVPWLLSRPEVYEAAIASGQFFLSLGLLFGYLAWESSGSRVWPAWLAGVAFGAAVASRLSLVPAIGFLGAAIILGVWRRTAGAGARGAALRTAVALSTPLLLGLLALGWYNSVRFGSALEPGHRYALTGLNLRRDYAGVLSLGNVSVNIFNYGLNPPRTLTVFPFVKPTWGRGGLGPITRLIPLSPIYQVEQVNGLVPTFPFVVFGLVPVVAALRRGGRATLAGSEGMQLAMLVLLGGLLALAPLFLFYGASMRYLADAVPLLAIAAVLGWWSAWPGEHGGPTRFGLYWVVTALLVCTSLAMGLLLAVTGYYARFEILNLELFEAITRFLAW